MQGHCGGYLDPDCPVHQRQRGGEWYGLVPRDVSVKEKYRLLGQGSYGIVYNIDNVVIGEHAPGSFAMKIQQTNTPHLARGVELEKTMFSILMHNEATLRGLVLPVVVGEEGERRLCIYDCRRGRFAKAAGSHHDSPCNVQIFKLLKAAERWNDRAHIESIFSDLKRLLENVRRLHEIGFAHGDLKPENILIESNGEGVVMALLADFGLSVWFKPGQSIVLNRRTEKEKGRMKGGTPYVVFPAFCLMVLVSREERGMDWTDQAWGKEVDSWSEAVPPARALPWYQFFLDWRENKKKKYGEWMGREDHGVAADEQQKDPRVLKISGEKISMLLEHLAPDFTHQNHLGEKNYCSLSPAILNDLFGLLVIIISNCDMTANDELWDRRTLSKYASPHEMCTQYSYESCLCAYRHPIHGDIPAYMPRMLSWISNKVHVLGAKNDGRGWRANQDAAGADLGQNVKFFEGVIHCAKIFNIMTSYIEEYALWIHTMDLRSQKYVRQALHWKYWGGVTKHYRDVCFVICGNMDIPPGQYKDEDDDDAFGGGRQLKRRRDQTQEHRRAEESALRRRRVLVEPKHPTKDLRDEPAPDPSTAVRKKELDIIWDTPATIGQFPPDLLTKEERAMSPEKLGDNLFEVAVTIICGERGEGGGNLQQEGTSFDHQWQPPVLGAVGGKRKKIKNRRKFKKSKKKIKKTKSLIHNTKLRRTKKTRLKKKRSTKSKIKSKKKSKSKK